MYPIAETKVNLKCRDASQKIALALIEIFTNNEYNEKIFSTLEEYIMKDTKNTGRPGMDLWQIFVMAQFRVGLNLSYDRLHHMANSDRMLRQLLGVETTGFVDHREEFSYQNILDNMELLSDELLKELNQIIISFGHKEVFKKKAEEVSILKTDSYVIESNVHFPTDYNLLWDCCRKSIDFISKFTLKYPEIEGWRKLRNWRTEFKNSCRRIGQISSKGGANKNERLKEEVQFYISKARLFVEKLTISIKRFPINTQADLKNILELEKFKTLTIKHIDLLERRILKGEIIPHHEKMFSVFETYTEWITKGKSRPSVELGKKLCITSDQFHLIVDYLIMENITDSEILIPLYDRILPKYKVLSWSFDKGFYSKTNKDILQLEVQQVVMPKKGKLTKAELEEEKTPNFIQYRHKHSAVESNINELENRGLDRCPDKGFPRFKRYVAIGICAYNLHKIGAKIMQIKIATQNEQRRAA
jgi:hypothetical protein